MNFSYHSTTMLHNCSILGFSANTPNQYVYSSNSPLAVKDPNGEIAPFIVIAAGILIDVGGYLLATPPNEYSAGGQCILLAFTIVVSAV